MLKEALVIVLLGAAVAAALPSASALSVTGCPRHLSDVLLHDAEPSFNQDDCDPSSAQIEECLCWISSCDGEPGLIYEATAPARMIKGML